MKNLIFLIMWFYVILFSYSYAQIDCGTVENCPHQKYPYTMCNPDNGKTIKCCIYNYGDACENNRDFDEVRKVTLPVCLEFIDSGPEEAYGEICGGELDPGDQKCRFVVVYKKENFINDMNKAAEKWNCLCNMQNQTCSCTVSIKFINKNNGEFIFPDFDVSSNSLERSGDEPGSQVKVDDKCHVECENVTIYLNNTQKFTQSESGTYDGSDYRRFYINDVFLDDKEFQGLISNDNFNLVNVITYELGKIMGIGNTETDGCAGDGFEGEIMDGNFDGEYRSPRRELSMNERCAFKKLYCPQYIPVKEYQEEQNTKSENFPNPFDNNTLIQFYVPEDGSEVAITIFNNLGIKISEIIITDYKKGRQSYIFDGNNYPSGVYHCLVRTKDNVTNTKMILVK